MLNLDSMASELRRLSERHRLSELSIFGSALRADFGPQSDVDVLVEFVDGVVLDEDDYQRLEKELVALFGRPVDVVRKRYLRNPFVRQEILQSRRVLYAA